MKKNKTNIGVRFIDKGEATISYICALLLPVGVLAAELLVGETPDPKGMLLFSVSCIFWTVGKQLPLRRQLAAVALWSVLFVAVSHIFTAPAELAMACEAESLNSAPEESQIAKAAEPVDSDSTGADAASAGEKSFGSNAERGAEMTDRDFFIYLLKNNLWVLLCVFVVCGAFVAAPTYRHRDVCSHQEKLARDFHDKDYRHVVRLMNRRINRRLKKDTRFGVTWKTDLEYEKLLCQTYRNVDEVTWKSYMRVVKKAAYSNEQPTADEAILCYDVYKSVLYLGFRR